MSGEADTRGIVTLQALVMQQNFLPACETVVTINLGS